MPNSLDVREGRVPDKIIENGVVVSAGLQKTEMTLAEHNDYLDTRKQPHLTEAEAALVHGTVAEEPSVLRKMAEAGAIVPPEDVRDAGPPNARGLRYLLEMNTKERSMLPEDLQQIYEWHESPQKWIMRAQYRSEFAQGAS